MQHEIQITPTHPSRIHLAKLSKLLPNLRVWSIAISLIQVMAAAGYGLKVLSDWGTDFGIYFVGAFSIAPRYGLYGDLFDLKGPLYYGFLKITSLFIPYNLTGAVLVLAITGACWLMAVNFVAARVSVSSKGQHLARLAGVCVLYQMPSNSSIGVFQSSLVLVSIASLLTFYKETRSYVASASSGMKHLVISSTFASLAALTRFDGLVASLLIVAVFFLLRKRLTWKMVAVCAISLGTVTFLVIVTLADFLNFDFSQWFYSEFVFVIENRWLMGTNSVLEGFLLGRNFLNALIILQTFVPVAIVLVTFSPTTSGVNRLTISMLVAVSIAVYILLASDKGYHVFSTYPFLILALTQAGAQTIRADLVTQFAIAGLASVAIWVALCSFGESRCISAPQNCPNPYTSLLQDAGSRTQKKQVFFMNQGWPFLLSGAKAKVNFDVYWPLRVYIPGSTPQVVRQSQAEIDSPIWVEKESLEDANPEIKKLFLANKIVTHSADGSWVRLDPAPSLKRH